VGSIEICIPNLVPLSLIVSEILLFIRTDRRTETHGYIDSAIVGDASFSLLHTFQRTQYTLLLFFEVTGIKSCDCQLSTLLYGNRTSDLHWVNGKCHSIGALLHFDPQWVTLCMKLNENRL